MLASLAVSTLLFLGAYLLGSLPTGYLAGRWLAGLDIRKCGSGSTGATNVARAVGNRAAAVVLGVDVLKGILAVGSVAGAYAVLSPTTLPPAWQPWLAAAAALGAIIGHSWPVWLGFAGGKSVATGLGVLLTLSPTIALGTSVAFALVVGASRIVSLGSLTAVVTAVGLAIALGEPLPYQLFIGVAGAYVVWRHRGNIARLLQGTEPRLGQSR